MAEENSSVDLSRYSPGPDYDPGPRWLRVLWYAVARIFFATSIPWPSAFKAAVLRFFGATIGEGVVLKPRVRIKHPWFLALGDHCWLGEDVWIDNVAPVTIGNHACLSQGASVFSGNHDRNSPTFDLRLGPVAISDGAWLGAKSVLCPGSRVESHAVLGAGAVGKGVLESRGIYEGNPARRSGTREIDPSRKGPAHER